mgnify:CR=1 FL=1
MDRFKSVDSDDRKSQVKQYSQDQKEIRKSTSSSYWIVSRGETIEFIARSTEVPVEDIAYYNSLSKPYKLSDGMRLFIAKRKSSANIDSSLTSQASTESVGVSDFDGVYEVKDGDTISTIAMKFGISVKQLIEFNQIANPSLIYVDILIKIKYIYVRVVKPPLSIIHRTLYIRFIFKYFSLKNTFAFHI